MSEYIIKFHLMLGTIGTDEHAVFEKEYETLKEASNALDVIAWGGIFLAVFFMLVGYIWVLLGDDGE